MARPSAGGGSKFMWARGTCMYTRVPASRRIRAKVLSTGTARVRKAPLVTHAARRSPNASKGRPQRQQAGANPPTASGAVGVGCGYLNLYIFKKYINIYLINNIL